MNKTCAGCKEILNIDNFYKRSREKDGFDYYCKNCRTKNTLKSHRGGHRKNRGCSVDNCNRVHYSKNLCKVHYTRNLRNGKTETLHDKSNGKYEYGRQYHLRYIFKKTVEEYNEMAKNGCYVCGYMGNGHKMLHMDHDHKCCTPEYDDNGKTKYKRTCGNCVRGVLCDACNRSVGLYERGILREDYPNRDKIIQYLKAYSDRIDTYDKEQGNR